MIAHTDEILFFLWSTTQLAKSYVF